MKTEDWTGTDQKGWAKKWYLKKRVEPMTLYCNSLQNLRRNMKFLSQPVPLLPAVVLAGSWYCTGHESFLHWQVATSGQMEMELRVPTSQWFPEYSIICRLVGGFFCLFLCYITLGTTSTAQQVKTYEEQDFVRKPPWNQEHGKDVQTTTLIRRSLSD